MKRILLLIVLCLLSGACDLITADIRDELNETRNIAIIAGVMGTSASGSASTSTSTGTLPVCSGCSSNSDCASTVCGSMRQDTDSNGFYGNSGDSITVDTRCVNASSQTVCGSIGLY